MTTILPGTVKRGCKSQDESETVECYKSEMSLGYNVRKVQGETLFQKDQELRDMALGIQGFPGKPGDQSLESYNYTNVTAYL